MRRCKSGDARRLRVSLATAIEEMPSYTTELTKELALRAACFSNNAVKTPTWPDRLCYEGNGFSCDLPRNS